MTTVPPALQLSLALLVVAATVYDVRQRRVPNWLSVSGVLAGLALNVVLHEFAGLWFSLQGLGLALLVYFPLFAIRAMGAGDAKLMAAVGAMVGPANWFGIFLLTSMTGGVFALCLVLATGRTRRTLANMWFLFKQLAFFRAPYLKHEELDVHSPKAVGLPHAAMISLGALGFLAAAAVWTPK
jgi:prepilin peptidase CpaA